MTLQTDPPQPQAPVVQTGKSRQITSATVLVLFLAWGCAWATDMRWPLVMALTIGILAVGIAVAAIRSMPWRRSQDPAKHSGAMLAFDNTDNLDHAKSPVFSARVHGKRWSLDVFQAIDAKRFAAVCETWFSWAGFAGGPAAGLARLAAHLPRPAGWFPVRIGVRDRPGDRQATGESHQGARRAEDPDRFRALPVCRGAVVLAMAGPGRPTDASPSVGREVAPIYRGRTPPNDAGRRSAAPAERLVRAPGPTSGGATSLPVRARRLAGCFVI